MAVVAAPTAYHHAVACDFLRRGVPLLIEKPLAAELDRADEMVSLAQRHGSFLQTGHIERFNPAFEELLRRPLRPKYVSCERCGCFTGRSTDVGAVLDLMIHDIDLILTLVGAEVTTVAASGIPVLTPMVDIANARVGFASGAVANITASRISRDRVRKVRIFQQNGYLSLDLAAGNGEFFELKRDIDLAKLISGPVDIADFVNRVQLTAPEGEPLRLEEVRLAGPRQGELLVRVQAAGVCHTDLHYMTGDLTCRLPAVLGHEGAGIVEEAGPGVSGIEPGDAVVLMWRPRCGRCEFCLTGRPALPPRAARLRARPRR